jgi:hypothetical protein
MRPFVKHVAWLCLALMLGSAFAFAAHHHSSSDESAACTVCAAAHSFSPVVAHRLPQTVFVRVQLIGAAEPVAAQQHLVAFALSVRPPPSV